MTIFSAMFIVLFALKLTNYINWSWWWVTSPLWGSAILIFLIQFWRVYIQECKKGRFK